MGFTQGWGGEQNPVANSKDQNQKPCRLLPGWMRDLVGAEDKMMSENRDFKA